MTRAHTRLFLSTGILALAAFLRLWQLAHVPPGLYPDEAFHILRAQEILRGEALPVYNMGNNGNEPLLTYLTALTLALLGPVKWSVRLATAWAGLLSVALTLRAGRELSPKNALGLLAGLSLAALYWNINFSRFGIEPILSAAAAAGVIAALWTADRTGRPLAYAAAGVSLGLGLVGYVAFRLFPLVPLCAGLALLVARRGRRLALLGGGFLAVGVALLIYSPTGLFFIQNPEWFIKRFDQTTQATLSTADPLAAILPNALTTLEGLFLSGDTNWRHNFPPRPALDAAQALFFTVGIGISLFRLHKPETWALFAWLGIGLIPSILTVEAPHFGRTVMVTPALALFIAVGIQTVWGYTRSRLAHGLVIAAVSLSICYTVEDYFGRWAVDPRTFIDFRGRQEWLANTLRQAPVGADYFVTPLDNPLFHHGYFTVEFLLGREAFTRFRMFSGENGCLLLPLVTHTTTIYAVNRQEDSHTLPTLEAAFPDGMHSTVKMLVEDAFMDFYQIPPGQAARVERQVQTQIDFGEMAQLTGYTMSAETLKPGDSLGVTLFWGTRQASDAAYKVFVHLTGHPKEDGNIIYTQRDSEPCGGSYPTWQWKPGDLLIDPYELSLPADMPPGDYTVQVGWYDITDPSTRLLAWDVALGQPMGDVFQLQNIHVSAP